MNVLYCPAFLRIAKMSIGPEGAGAGAVGDWAWVIWGKRMKKSGIIDRRMRERGFWWAIVGGEMWDGEK